MPSVKELREKRKALAPRLREMADKAHAEKRDFTAEEKKNWEDLNKEVNQLGADIDRLENVEELERKLKNPGNPSDPGRDRRNGKRERERGSRNSNPNRPSGAIISGYEPGLPFKPLFPCMTACLRPSRRRDP